MNLRVVHNLSKASHDCGAFVCWTAAMVAVAFLAATSLHAQPIDEQTETVDARIADVETFIAEIWDEQPRAGITLGISAPGLRWVKGFGYADVAKKRLATETTSYRMASVTKTMTAVAVLQLVEDGKVDLDAEVQRYVPLFPKKKEPVVIRQLLGHLAGISHYRNRAKETHFQRPYTTAESLAVFKDWPLVAPPGERFIYTSYGFNLLGAVVEKQSGLPFDRYLQRRLFRPLGIEGAGVERRNARRRHWARGYKLVKGKLRRSESVDISSRFGGGGVRASVLDMVRFGEGLIAGDLLHQDTFALMHAPMATDDGVVTDYGMGIATYPFGGRWLLAHSGSQAETSTLLWLFPAEGLVIAIAQNLEDQGTTNRRVLERVAEIFLFGGERRRGLAGVELRDHMMIEGLTRIYAHGLGQYRLHGRRIDEGTGDLLRAFRTADRILEPGTLAADPVAGFERIQQGLGPRSDRSLPKVGAYMAAVIAAQGGVQALDAYGPTSTVAFIRDYLEACTQTDCPDGLLPSSVVQAFVRRVDPALEEANTASLRQWQVPPSADPDEVGKRLRRAFMDAPVVPDFSSVLHTAGQRALFTGEVARAFAWLEQAHALYPHDARTSVGLGLVRYATNDHARGDLLMHQAACLPGAMKLLAPARLRYAAWRLEKAGFKAGARDLVDWAARYHQTDASLWVLLATKRAALGDGSGAAQARAHARTLESSSH